MVKEHDQLQKTLQSMGDLSAQFSESKRTAKELDQQLSAATLENKELHCQLETANAQVVYNNIHDIHI